MDLSTIPNTNTELIAALSKRTNSQPSWVGIGLASDYLNALRPCLANDDCFKRMMSGVSPQQWELACKHAANQLTFAMQECWEKDAQEKLATSESGMRAILKSIEGGAPDLPKHCAMVFRNVLTTSAEDRDRDILEPAGAIIDTKMPLLWQHLQPSPIGKLLGLVERSRDFVKVASCICDVSDLAFDSIKMVEAGILRISHGFKPKRFEPLPARNGDQLPPGFNVKTYEVVEESVVSVPSNVGAVVEAYSTLLSRKQLKSEIVKAFGQEYWERRDTAGSVATGFDQRQLDVNREITVKVVVENGTVTKDAAACGCDIKSTAMNAAGDIGKPAADTSGKPNPGVSEMPNSVDADMEEKKKRDAKAKKDSEDEDQGEKLTEEIQSALSESMKSDGKSGDFTLSMQRFTHAQKTGVKDGFIEWSKSGEEVIVLHVVPKGLQPSYEVPASIKLYANIEGSFEWTSQMLGEQLRKYLLGQSALGNIPYNTDSPEYDWASLEATKSDHAVVRISGRSGDRYYKVPYTIENGTPKFSLAGQIQEIQVAAIVREEPKGFHAHTKNSLIRIEDSVTSEIRNAAEFLVKSSDVGARSIGETIIAKLNSLKSCSKNGNEEQLNGELLTRNLAAFSISAGEQDLPALKEIANIASLAHEGLRAIIESRQLDDALSAIVS